MKTSSAFQVISGAQEVMERWTGLEEERSIDYCRFPLHSCSAPVFLRIVYAIGTCPEFRLEVSNPIDSAVQRVQFCISTLMKLTACYFSFLFANHML